MLSVALMLLQLTLMASQGLLYGQMMEGENIQAWLMGGEDHLQIGVS